MFRFNTIEDIFDCMLSTVDVDYPVSVVANEFLIKELLRQFMTYDCVDLEFCDINSIGYDREYILTLNDDEECGLVLSVDKAYYAEKDIYLSTDGFVLFHENVPCKAQIDMEKNEYTEFEFDWFVLTCDEEEDNFGFEDDECCGECCCNCGESCECDKGNELITASTAPSTYFMVNGKEVDAATYGKALEEFNARLNAFENTFRRFLRMI